MTDVDKAKYAGKLLGQVEAYATEADKINTQIHRLAHRLTDLLRNAVWNDGQLTHYAADVLSSEDKIGLRSTLARMANDVALASKILR